MPDMKYTKEDLMWEATRRNQDYKNDYASMLEEFRNVDANLNNSQLWRKKKKWELLLSKVTEKTSMGNRVQFICWLDPSVVIDDIKREIKSGTPDISIHPYAYTKVKPNAYYHHANEINKNNNFVELQFDDEIYICIKKLHVGNKFLFLIDPTSTDDSIMGAVQEAKGKVLKSIKNQIEPLKQKGEKPFSPVKIDKYIGWLKKYDELVENLTAERGSDKLTYKDGAVIIPKGVSFKGLIPNNALGGNNIESQIKAYREAYKGAVELIQTTPNIRFSPSRT